MTGHNVNPNIDDSPNLAPVKQSRDFLDAMVEVDFSLSDVPTKGHVSDYLRKLADYADSVGLGEASPDMYGGGIVRALETRVQEIFGFDQGVFFPTGTMAQQVALRYWSEKQESRSIALHKMSHPLVFENGAMELLTGLNLVPFVNEPRSIVASDLTDLPISVGTLMLELPLRDAGYVLPTWDELRLLVDAARVRDMRIHIDGARIWEAAHYWKKDLSELRHLSDSIYVSFYKSLGALSGAILLCDSELAEYAITWRHRYGGRVFKQFPTVISALHGMDTHLAKLDAYVGRAKWFAGVLEEELKKVDFPRWEINPRVPHINQFQVSVELPSHILNEVVIQNAISRRRSLFSSPWWDASVSPALSVVDMSVGQSGLNWDAEDVRLSVRDFIIGVLQAIRDESDA